MSKDKSIKIPPTLDSVPTSPGVYFFSDTKGKILYIGKAKNLKNRVRSYFQKNKYQTPKNQSMVKRISDIEWIITSNEVEAIFTEANLIKQHQPKYNVDLKDGKSFPFIRITNEPFPQVFLTRKIVKDGSRYFGPYTDVNHLRAVLKMIHHVYQIRSCTFKLDRKTIEDKKVSLCLDYHIKKCGGPCEGLVSEKEYDRMIATVTSFLHGKTSDTERFLLREMNRGSDEQRFEDAARVRDQLESVQRFKNRQRKVSVDFSDRDIFSLAHEEEIGVVVIVRVRGGRFFSREKIYLRQVRSPEEALESVITRFYLDSFDIPREITLPFAVPNEDTIYSWLSEKRERALKIKYPQRGEKARELRVAHQNAKLLLGEWILKKKKRREYIPNSLKQLQDDLQLKAPPRKIEAFDISHLGGTNTVASMVYFKDGKPVKKNYRKYNIKTITGIDDFASVREVVIRRYKRLLKEKSSLPDLILIDGGKGQLSMAVSALRQLGIAYVPVIGLAKRLEEVFLPGQSEPQSISKSSPGLLLLRRVRDEAHRFAVSFQRQKRSKSVKESPFLSISGMGPKRVNNLFIHYQNIADIAKAEPRVLSRRISISKGLSAKCIALAEEMIL